MENTSVPYFEEGILFLLDLICAESSLFRNAEDLRIC